MSVGISRNNFNLIFIKSSNMPFPGFRSLRVGVLVKTVFDVESTQ
jgi:hypothetical protein